MRFFALYLALSPIKNRVSSFEIGANGTLAPKLWLSAGGSAVGAEI
jgi:hypothetical protein